VDEEEEEEEEEYEEEGEGRLVHKQRRSNGKGDLDLLLARISFMLATYSAVRRCTKRKKEIQGTAPNTRLRDLPRLF
jgi:hypothetical protein